MQKQKIKIRKSVKWFIVTFLLIIAMNIYNHFGHGVFAWQMNYSWVPAIIVAFIRLFQEITKNKFIASRNWYLINLSVWILTIGLIIWGIFLIAGTGSTFVQLYFYTGILLFILGFVLKNRHPKKQPVRSQQKPTEIVNPMLTSQTNIQSTNSFPTEMIFSSSASQSSFSNPVSNTIPRNDISNNEDNKFY